MLTEEMKREIIEYILPQGSYSKGLIEDTGLVASAYGDTVSSDDIYNFIDECRAKLLPEKSSERNGMDIEFIICWSDNSWTVETDRIDDPPLDGNDGLCYTRLCEDKLGRIVADLESSKDIMDCPRGSVVHVGIYHVGEPNEGS